MKYDLLEIVEKATGTCELPCVVPANASLGEVARRVDLQRVAYVLVENANAQLVGIVESKFILQRLSAENEIERKRWSEMDIESSLQWKIAPGSSLAKSLMDKASKRVQCTAVSSNDGVMALVSDKDVFVSWQLVRDSLTQAMIDPVSSLPNRMVYDRRLSEEIDRSRREGHSIAVVLFDIDYFKKVNDTYGHAVGDAAILTIGQQLKNLLRSYDVLARYGGDEFAAICCACGRDEIDIPLRRIQSQLSACFSHTSISLPPITLSIGAAVVHDLSSHLAVDDLLELADACLYRAKEHGRNCAFKIEVDHLKDQGAPVFVGRPESDQKIRPDVTPLVQGVSPIASPITIDLPGSPSSH